MTRAQITSSSRYRRRQYGFSIIWLSFGPALQRLQSQADLGGVRRQLAIHGPRTHIVMGRAQAGVEQVLSCSRCHLRFMHVLAWALTAPQFPSLEPPCALPHSPWQEISMHVHARPSLLLNGHAAESDSR